MVAKWFRGKRMEESLGEPPLLPIEKQPPAQSSDYKVSGLSPRFVLGATEDQLARRRELKRQAADQAALDANLNQDGGVVRDASGQG